jgi:nitrogenase molybdenum-iron protein alpha/beta subunit
MSNAHDKTTLEDFALKGMHHAKMTGVMTATHAISDSFLLMHTGVGCKYKTASQAAQHDLAEHPNVREAWTQVSEAHLVAGCSDRIGPFARAWWERRKSAFMLVVSAYFIELTGDDIPQVLKDVEATLPGCEMAYVATKAPNLGFFDGYAGVVHEVMKRMDWSKPPRAPRQASVIGHFFHRHEPDVKADTAQIRTLIKAAGLDSGAILFSGSSYAECKRAPESRFQLMMPYMAPARSALTDLAGQAGREVVQLDLPIGISGTTRFVREITRASGGDVAKVEAWAASQAEAVMAQYHRLAEVLHRTSWAVFADTPLAAGLVTMLIELGARVPLVGLRDPHVGLGGRASFDRTLAANGITLPPDTEILENPSLRVTKQRSLAYVARDAMGIIGSTHELAIFRHIESDDYRSSRVPLVETGFPSDNHHLVMNMPTYGFAGVAAWAQRLVEVERQPQLGSGGS